MLVMLVVESPVTALQAFADCRLRKHIATAIQNITTGLHMMFLVWLLSFSSCLCLFLNQRQRDEINEITNANSRNGTFVFRFHFISKLETTYRMYTVSFEKSGNFRGRFIY